MMESKYYTPEIEEFHVGFEYEVKSKFNNEWEKWKQSDPSPKSIFYPKEAGDRNPENPFKLIPFEWVLGEGHVRVKVLDRDDIENCGWKFDAINEINNEIFYKMVDESARAKLRIDFKTRLIEISAKDQFGNKFVIFIGMLNNKSELKKLMKQLLI